MGLDVRGMNGRRYDIERPDPNDPIVPVKINMLALDFQDGI